MDLPFLFITILTIVSALAAVSLRNLVHCALCLAVSLAGLASFYLHLDSQFVGLAQILVYIGAVAILIVFAILLTRNSETPFQKMGASGSGLGVGVAVLAFGALAVSIFSSSLSPHALPARPEAPIKAIGEKLMTSHVLALEVAGLLLTAALIGGVIIAQQETKPKS